jgi:hypothetical protein
MTIENNTKSEEAKDATNSTSDFGQWNAFAWNLIRSLAIVAAGTTAIVFICRWLIY